MTETLGATTFICTDKTGTLTQNRMAVREVTTAYGTVHITGTGYEPVATLEGPADAVAAARDIARAALACVTGRVVHVIKRKMPKWHVERGHHATWPQPQHPPDYRVCTSN